MSFAATAPTAPTAPASAAEQLQQRRPASAVSEAATTASRPSSIDRGHWIDEAHANYILMYVMLMGIRFAVSRTQAKAARTHLTALDFTTAHKRSFDAYVLLPLHKGPPLTTASRTQEGK